MRPAVGFHELRHTYASLLAQAGVDLLTISKLLGHADTESNVTALRPSLRQNTHESCCCAPASVRTCQQQECRERFLINRSPALVRDTLHADDKPP